MVIRQIQLGKRGITENFISSLKKQFEKVQIVKITVLKSFCRDKQKLKEFSKEIIDKLGKNYTERTIGYTIAIRKWRKAKR